MKRRVMLLSMLLLLVLIQPMEASGAHNLEYGIEPGVRYEYWINATITGKYDNVLLNGYYITDEPAPDVPADVTNITWVLGRGLMYLANGTVSHDFGVQWLPIGNWSLLTQWLPHYLEYYYGEEGDWDLVDTETSWGYIRISGYLPEKWVSGTINQLEFSKTDGVMNYLFVQSFLIAYNYTSIIEIVRILPSDLNLNIQTLLIAGGIGVIVIAAVVILKRRPHKQISQAWQDAGSDT